MIYKIKIGWFIFLGIITIGSVFLIDPYEQSGLEMLENESWLISKPKKGVALVDGDGLYLSSSDAGKGTSIRQTVKSRGGFFQVRLSADIRSRDVVPGEKSWNKARLLLVQYDGKSARYNVPHMVAGLEGTHDWEHYRGEFHIQPWATEFKVVAQLSRCTGSMEMKNIRLFPVVLSPVYIWAKRIIIGSWGMFFTFLLGSCMVKGRYGVQGIMVISFAAILFGTMIPEELKTAVYGWVMDQIQVLQMLSGDEGEWIIGKAGHFCFFAVFGLGMLMSGKSLASVGANILMLAVGTELVQFFIEGRTPLVTDFFIDFSGGMAGLVLGCILAGIRRVGIRRV